MSCFLITHITIRNTLTALNISLTKFNLYNYKFEENLNNILFVYYNIDHNKTILKTFNANTILNTNELPKYCNFFHINIKNSPKSDKNFVLWLDFIKNINSIEELLLKLQILGF